MLNPHIQARLNTAADLRLIATSTIIHYSTVELEQVINRELDENPALELVEHVACPICGKLLYGTSCASCLSGTPEASTASAAEYAAGTGEMNVEDEHDSFWSLAAPQTLADSLLEQLRLVLDARGQEVALHIVGNLDERGYFTTPLAEIAYALHVDVSQVQLVLQELQDLDPPGIGARTLEECLLLQMQWLQRQGMPIPTTARIIIKDHLEALGCHRFEHIRRVLGISRQEVEETFHFIRTNLHPYPANHYYGQGCDPHVSRSRVKPSLLIQRRATEPSGYDVEVIESHHHLVRMNPLYQQLHRQDYHAMSTDERAHVNHFLDRARLFIGALHRRHHVLQQLAMYLVTAQRDFLDHGPRYLRPLTQTRLAKELGVHPSTVSRATAGKFVQLPSQALLPLQSFFAPETCAQALVQQMIRQETLPLSDEQIASRLRDEQSISVSRQMIANYRANLKIPAARQRALLWDRKRSVE